MEGLESEEMGELTCWGGTLKAGVRLVGLTW